MTVGEKWHNGRVCKFSYYFSFLHDIEKKIKLNDNLGEISLDMWDQNRQKREELLQ